MAGLSLRIGERNYPSGPLTWKVTMQQLRLRTEDLSWNRPQADDARRAGPVSATPARATCGNVEHKYFDPSRR